jgi:predicted nucleic acid-binding protein
VTVVDTTILVDLLRGLPAALETMEALDRPLCCEVTRVELLRGLRPAEASAAADLFDAVDWIPVDKPIARRAGELGQRYGRSHPGIGLADLIIAATAIEAAQPLATLNVRHFPMFRRLRPPYRP